MGHWWGRWTLALAWLLAGPGTAWAGAPAGFLPELQARVNQAVEQIKPSVVSIKAQKRQWLQGGGEMWYESIGSGIVVDERGSIVTNSHVIKGAEKILVGFWTKGGVDTVAQLVQDAPDQDLALLRADAAGPSAPAVLGDSSSLAIGDWVVSVGSPFGYEHSATFGMVSALHRNLLIEGLEYPDMIQTDATINQGNSGGPLLDLQGAVVGLSAAVFSPENAFTGIGFAIPVNRVRQFISGLIATPAVTPAATQARPAFKPLPSGTMARKPGPKGPLTFQPLPTAAAPQVGQSLPFPSPAPNTPQGFPPPMKPTPSFSLAGPLAAAQVPVDAPPAKKVPVDLNKPMPKDAKHAEFSDCTACHDITKKLPANMQLGLPHPPVAPACETCHVLVSEKVVQGPTTVAWTTVLARIPGGGPLTVRELVLCLSVLAIALLSAALGLDAGLLFVPVLLAYGLDIGIATATSLLLLNVKGIPTMSHFKGSELIDMRLIAVVTPPAMLAAFGGGLVMTTLSPLVLGLSLSGSLLVAAMFMLRDPSLASAWGGRPDKGGWAWRTRFQGVDYTLDLVLLGLCIAMAAFAGGLLGAGGSWLLIPLLLTVFRVPFAVAGAVSAVVVPVVGLFGFLGHALAGDFKIPLLVPLCMAALIGAMVGMLFSGFRGKAQPRLAASISLGLAGAWVVLRTVGLV